MKLGNRQFNRQKGFTILEILIAVVIVGIGFSAVMFAMLNGTVRNASSKDLTKANFLANEIREFSLSLPYNDPDGGVISYSGSEAGENPLTEIDDLDDLNGKTFSPPCRAPQAGSITVEPIAGYDGQNGNALWSQEVTLSWRLPQNPSVTVEPGLSDLVYVRVTIKKRVGNSAWETVLTTGWLVRNK